MFAEDNFLLLLIVLYIGANLHSNLSRMTMTVWLFVALIITSSYTASLTSLLAHRLIPIPDVATLKRNGDKVGCDGNSFVLQYLVNVLHFDPKNIEPIFSENRHRQALTSGEIAAAFLEVPYVKLFLAKNCKNFTTGPMYSVGGFGFVSILSKDRPLFQVLIILYVEEIRIVDCFK